MISILLLVFLFRRTFGFASPLSVQHVATTFEHLERDLPICECPFEQRTVWSILWSCLATTFTCTWVSVHPNIPDPDDSAWKVAKRRAGLMIWTILAPELVVFWAIRQWIGARQLTDKFHEFGWTKTHGYFLQMGGFMLYDSDGKSRDRVLKGRDLEQLFKEGKIMFPTITEEEIQDCSKGDGLTKAITIFQTTWFVAQCIARHVQRLVVTELEIITLAFATLNGMMYFFWWNKPLGVRYSVPVFLLKEPRAQQTLVEKENQSILFRDWVSKSIHQMYNFCRQSCAKFSLKLWELQWSWKAILGFPLNFLGGLLGPIADFCQSEYTIQSSHLRVGTRHAENIHGSSYSYRLGPLVVVIGILFGAIHCTAWSSPFPSNPERTLWRICSLILISIPGLLFLGYAAMDLKPHTYLSSKFWRAMEGILILLGAFLITISTPLYVLARLTLIVEAFITLRALTPAALAEIHWASFIPHI